MTASAVISVLLVGFRHLSDDGLGCLILFMDAAVLLLLPLDIFRFSVFGFQGTTFHINSDCFISHQKLKSLYCILVFNR